MVVTHNKLAPSLLARAHKGQTHQGNDGWPYKSTRYPSGQYRWKRVRESRSRSRSRSRGRRMRSPRRSYPKRMVVRREPRVLHVTAFTKENTGDPDYEYTYRVRTTRKQQPAVIRAIKKCMKDHFCDVQVCHRKGHKVNEFAIYSTGPEEGLSQELKRLADMGFYSPFALKVRGGEFDWYRFKRVKEIPASC